MALRASTSGWDRTTPRRKLNEDSSFDPMLQELKVALRDFVQAAIDDNMPKDADKLDRFGFNLSSVIDAAVDAKIQALKLTEAREKLIEPGDVIHVRPRTFDVQSKMASYEFVILRNASIANLTLKGLHDQIKASFAHLIGSKGLIKVFYQGVEIEDRNLHRVLKEAKVLEFTAERGIEVLVSLPVNPPKWTQKYSDCRYLSFVLPVINTIGQLRRQFYDLVKENDGAAFTPLPAHLALPVLSLDETTNDLKMLDEFILADRIRGSDSSRIEVSVTTYCHDFTYGAKDKWFGRGNGNVLNNSGDALNDCNCSPREMDPCRPKLHSTSSWREKYRKLTKEDLIDRIGRIEGAESDCEDAADDESKSTDLYGSPSYIDSEAETGTNSCDLHEEEEEAMQILKREKELVLRGEISNSPLNDWTKQPLTPDAVKKVYNRPFAESVASDNDSYTDDSLSDLQAPMQSRIQVTPQPNTERTNLAARQEEIAKSPRSHGNNTERIRPVDRLQSNGQYPRAEHNPIPGYQHHGWPSSMGYSSAASTLDHNGNPNRYIPYHGYQYQGWPGYMQPSNRLHMSGYPRYIASQQSSPWGPFYPGSEYVPRRPPHVPQTTGAAMAEYLEKLGNPAPSNGVGDWGKSGW